MSAPSLPRPRQELLGREAEVAATLSILRRDTAGLLTLTGVGGTGKTRLALALAAALEPDFPDGVVFVSLAAIRDPDLVPTTIAAALGVPDVPGGAPAEQLAAYLRERRVLLVLDNFEQVLPAAPLVPALVAQCPALSLLVTSRAPLRLSNEQEYLVPPLPLPKASRGQTVQSLAAYASVELFCQRASAIQHDFRLTPENVEAVAEICRRLDGLPLAIELAAARVRALSPPALLARLEHRLRLLTDGARDVADRHASLRDTIAWSYDLIAPPEQALFARLAVFEGSFTLDDAASVCNPEDEPVADILDGLTALVEHNLLQRDDGVDSEPWFSVLATIDEFGRERFSARGDAELLRQRHATAMVVFANRTNDAMYSASAQAWIPRAEARLADVRAAFDWAVTRGEAEAAMFLAAGLVLFWHDTGRHFEGQTRLQAALALEGAAAPTFARAQALSALGRWHIWTGHNRAGRVLLEECIAILREHDVEARMLAACLAWYGLTLLDDPAAAREAVREAERLISVTDDTWWRALVLLLAGFVELTHGDADRARVLMAEAARLYRVLDDRSGLMYVLASLGQLEVTTGRRTAAAAPYEECLKLARTLRNPTYEGWSLRGLGDIALAHGYSRRASTLFAASLSPAREAGNQSSFAVAVVGLAQAAAELGCAIEAVRLSAAATALWERLGGDRPLAALSIRARQTADVARATLGEESCNAAWAEGEALSQEQVIAQALTLAEELAPAPAAPHRATNSTGVEALTARQVEVLRLLATGRSNKEIAGVLGVRVRTIETHLTKIYSRIAARGRTDAVMFALRHGIGRS